MSRFARLRSTLFAAVMIAAALVLLRPEAARAQGAAVRGFADGGAAVFSAGESFETVLGSRTGPIFGGGAEVVLRRGIFANLRISRFQKSGERVFVFEGETFELGIPTTVRIMPIEVSGGYRFGFRASRVIPYIGGGLGWHRYRETSDFAEDDENVDETHSGYHLLGGAEVRVARWFGIGGEAQWTTVPDALGQDPNGVSAEFGETDLGGFGFRVKLTIGR